MCAILSPDNRVSQLSSKAKCSGSHNSIIGVDNVSKSQGVYCQTRLSSRSQGFFVDHDYQEKNQQIISPGVLVDHDYQADVKVFIVDHDYQATIKILRNNFPK